MTSRLIQKIAQKVTVDYCRLTFVENPDRFLFNDEVCRLLCKEQGLEIVKGSQLSLRIHFELHYKQNPNSRYVYICNHANALLPDLKKEGVKLEFSITDVFPLFADKTLLRKESLDVLEVLYSEYVGKRVSLTEGKCILANINSRVSEQHQISVATFRYRLQVGDFDWKDLPRTIRDISTILTEAIGAGVIDDLWNEVIDLNQKFQKWLDESYFSTLVSSSLIAPKSVNRILPHLSTNYHQDDKLALVVVDGMSYWQYIILKSYLKKNGFKTNDNSIVSWLPSITMLSRQAIFRGETPLQDYQQNPQNEAKLWKNYWQQRGFSDFEVQYLYNTDEFTINDGVKRLSFVTIEMDEKIHASADLKELHLLTEYWCTRFISKLEAIAEKGFTIYFTADHGNVLAKGWRSIKQEEKVYLFKDGSRGDRHLIYTDKEEQNRFANANAELNLLSHDNWLCLRDDKCFASNKTEKITHGGSHFMEVAIPFIKITK